MKGQKPRYGRVGKVAFIRADVSVERSRSVQDTPKFSSCGRSQRGGVSLGALGKPPKYVVDLICRGDVAIS
ncbi:unnamed protein product [Caenorhabditis auriculariae]|uniref:Uncharacterized protein n=1 Tax=Caenorhabditis auriculariae TaxID=2777116 RepID=A0A8S1GXD0_9PELO|nr:unnamed protein product [Caenorhabditis auriculariae]